MVYGWRKPLLSHSFFSLSSTCLFWSPTHHVVVSRHRVIASMVLSRLVFLPARVSQHIYLLGPSATSAFLGLVCLSRSCSRILCLRQSSPSSSQSDSHYIGTSWPSDWRPYAKYSGNLEDAWISDFYGQRNPDKSWCCHFLFTLKLFQHLNLPVKWDQTS